MSVHDNGIEEVVGSIPSGSTTIKLLKELELRERMRETDSRQSVH
jgi:hypothetical protein